jgi:AraC-like DNA-binding protein
MKNWGKLRQDCRRLEEQQRRIRKRIEEARLASGLVIDYNLNIRRAYRTSDLEVVATKNETFDEASQEAHKSLEHLKKQCERMEDLTRQLIDRLNAHSNMSF